jgi:hypothetical protein
MQVIFKQKNIALKEHIFSLKIDILLPAHNNFMEVRLKKRVLSYRQRNREQYRVFLKTTPQL